MEKRIKVKTFNKYKNGIKKEENQLQLRDSTQGHKNGFRDGIPLTSPRRLIVFLAEQIYSVSTRIRMRQRMLRSMESRMMEKEQENIWTMTSTERILKKIVEIKGKELE